MWLEQETLRPVNAFRPSRGCVNAADTATILSRLSNLTLGEWPEINDA